MGNRTALYSPPPLRGRIQVGGKVARVSPPILTFPLTGGKGFTVQSDCKTPTHTPAHIRS